MTAAPADALLDRAVALVEGARSACDGTVVIGIDGPSGSGKSTLASGLEARLGWPVVHMDDLFPGWDGLAEAADLLTAQVFEPLARGADATYRTWNWEASAWGDTVRLPWTTGLIVEGCASTTGPAAGFVALPIWVEADPVERMRRGLERDGEAFRPHWQRWAAQERALFAADGTRDRAALIVRT